MVFRSLVKQMIWYAIGHGENKFLRSFTEMEKFEIRKAKQKDKKDILKIFESYKPNHWDIKPANEHFTRFFESGDFPHDEFFVGLIKKRIVSVIGYYHDLANETGWLEWFYTHKDYNHRGIGKRMCNFVVS